MDNRQNIFRSLPIVANAIGRSCGVNVYLGGDVACTDGKNIYLPVADDISQQALLGFLLHEAAHVRFSDFEVVKTISNEVIRHIANSYEDARIERELGSIYAGANNFLRHTMRYMVDLNAKESNDQANAELDPLAVIVNFVSLNCWDRHRFLGDVLKEELAKVEGHAKAIFPQSLLDSIQAINDRIVHAKSTADTLQMAKDVVELLKAFAKDLPQSSQGQEQSDTSNASESDGQDGNGQSTSKPSPKSNSNKANDSSSNNDGEQDASSGQGNGQDQGSQSCSEQCGNDQDSSLQGASQADSDANGTDQSGQETQNPCQGQNQDDQNRQGKDNSSSQSRESSQGAGNSSKTLLSESDFEGYQSDDSFDISKSMKREIEDKANRSSEEATGRVLGSVESTVKNPALAREIYENSKKAANGLKRQLAGLVAQAARTKTMMRQTGRKVHSGKLTRLITGNTRVFKRTVEHESTASAVHILVDMSGSMSGMEKVAGEAATSLFLALSALAHTNPALTSFPGVRSSSVALLKHGEELNSLTAQKLAEFDAYGGTPLYKALQDVVLALACTKEKRKVVIVITDGEPDDMIGTKSLIKRMQLSGIDVYGIGIKYDVSHLFEKSQKILQISELSKALVDIARNTSLMAID